jgi:hypothetical protein
MSHHFPYPPMAPSLHLFGGEGWGGVVVTCQRPDVSVATPEFAIAAPV